MSKLESIQRKYPNEMTISTDAGSYLCNFIYYLALNYNRAAQVLFIHTADPIKNKTAIGIIDQKQIIQEVIANLLKSSI